MADPGISKKQIVRKSERISDWYTDVILKAELADYAPVKGCMVIRPYGYAIWEKIQAYMDQKIKEKGVQNAYFPLFIPERFLEKEKEHVEGFSPHLAVVTVAGGETLKEKLVVRPTSETIMYDMFKKWTQSYRDLPIRTNQWCNIVRWEKRTYLFLRTSEFLWQEGHGAFLSHEENMEMVRWAIDMYGKTYTDLLAMYPVIGVKSDSEKFAGGDQTYTAELLMPDGKALQACTSHDLGQNFAKGFDWTVLDKAGKSVYPHQNSWGFSTRSIGGMILVHGDDQGLVLPPAVASIQVVIVPVKADPVLARFASSVRESLSASGIRTYLDDRDTKSFGWKLNEWEVKGVPLRIEIGMKEMEQKKLTLYRRDTQHKELIDLGDLSSLSDVLSKIQKGLLEKHKKFTLDHTREVSSYDEFKACMGTKRGFIRAFWCGNPACEKSIKDETKATTRCLPLTQPQGSGTGKEHSSPSGPCVYCGKPSMHRWLFAQSY